MIKRLVFSKICISVRDFHAAGFVHYDLKPENLAMDLDGNVHLIDFDKARKFQEEGENLRVLGTQGYLAPELLTEGLGIDGKKVDIWALGTILFELGTGLPIEQLQNQAVSPIDVI